MANLKLAAGFIVYRIAADGLIEYLLLKASYPPYHWTPPKGHVDPGETEITTAYRETTEEAGLLPNDLDVNLDFKKELNYEVKGKPKRVTYWLAKLKNTKSVKLSDEHTDLVWADLEKSVKLMGYLDIGEVYRACEVFIKSTLK